MESTGLSLEQEKKISPDTILVPALSALLLLSAWLKWLPLDLTEAWGFATGALCVWLVTKGNIWNWPIGLANNIFFAILFWRARLYADCGLQGVYLAFGIWGWWTWLHGGQNRSKLKVSHASRVEWIAIAVFLIAGTWGLRELLIKVNGAAPFWDALSTVICLAAQYLLCRKKIENWWLWITADLIYVPLYASKELPLTAALYAGFIVLCILGLKRWRKELQTQPA
ncbi:nicotinamide riboside transporter PnuC [Luteolibacter sp. GHJ8]|uniref:Nicotinamide riboside transporter PnuC n=1 Tax=Luteolibacter rhizosphaerae TaxID=2989719 RepID=A0ABT3G1U3_9BACT|nr:nicotinamide riboside transporter PnuC [Luteolibacter rhizosphaerae]MCW1913501.1 nicotinamide riboside transporter PnuC [Luteolibacter rhizosphaerae]